MKFTIFHFFSQVLKEARAEAKAIMIKSSAETKSMREKTQAWADIIKAALALIQAQQQEQQEQQRKKDDETSNELMNTQSRIMMKLGLFPDGFKAVLESTRDFWTCLVWLPLLVLLASTDILI